MKHYILWILYALTALLTVGFSLFFAVLLMEWMAGCGESYIDADGVWHQYECLFLTLHK